MCGICGIFNYNAVPLTVKSIHSMNDAQFHREALMMKAICSLIPLKTRLGLQKMQLN